MSAVYAVRGTGFKPAPPMVKSDAKWDAWKAINKEAAEWLLANASKSAFAGDLIASVNRYGGLTPNQFNAVQRSIDREAAAKVAPAISVEKIEQAFAKAIGFGIKAPKLLLDVFKFKPAKATGANPGAIYVTEADTSEYLGKIVSGRFQKVQYCTSEQAERIVAAAADPEAAAVAFGKQFGQCSVCARPLTDPKSVERGIGPICAERMGW